LAPERLFVSLALFEELSVEKRMTREHFSDFVKDFIIRRGVGVHWGEMKHGITLKTSSRNLLSFGSHWQLDPALEQSLLQWNPREDRN
jgi:hypothetical protein